MKFVLLILPLILLGCDEDDRSFDLRITMYGTWNKFQVIVDPVSGEWSKIRYLETSSYKPDGIVVTRMDPASFDGQREVLTGLKPDPLATWDSLETSPLREVLFGTDVESIDVEIDVSSFGEYEGEWTVEGDLLFLTEAGPPFDGMNWDLIIVLDLQTLRVKTPFQEEGDLDIWKRVGEHPFLDELHGLPRTLKPSNDSE